MSEEAKYCKFKNCYEYTNNTYCSVHANLARLEPSKYTIWLGDTYYGTLENSQKGWEISFSKTDMTTEQLKTITRKINKFMEEQPNE